MKNRLAKGLGQSEGVLCNLTQCTPHVGTLRKTVRTVRTPSEPRLWKPKRIKRQRLIFTVESLANGTIPDLRDVLKRLLRGHKWRCVDIRPAEGVRAPEPGRAEKITEGGGR
jgi:hypothetical protein